jgi:trk/ktr system potassium uptake protein
MVTAFAGGVVVGTGLLMLPAARSGPGSAGFLEAFFTSTSAICVTGLSTVDVAQYWSPFGQVVILALIQVGGFGIMTLASLLGLLVARRLGLRTRLNAATETNTVLIGDVRAVLWGVLRITLLLEVVTALALSARFIFGYDEGLGRGLWLGVFHAISAFNNAGFSLFSDSLMSFVGDPWISLPIDLAVIVGGLGFPVLLELRRIGVAPAAWSLHTRITVWGTLVLLVAGFVFLTAVEWSNPATLGALDQPSRLLAGFTASVQPRTAGFNSIDYAQMHDSSLFATTTMMFIGGGSASTAGGVKVTTFFLLFFVMVAEVRGHRDVELGSRRIETRGQRQALTVGLLAIGLVLLSTLALMLLEPLSLQSAMFEVVSAFGTVGLTTGVTPTLGAPAQVLLVFLMFIGRIGPVTLVSALALRERQHLYRLPEGRPLIG